MKVTTVEAMRRLDERAIREFGIPEQLLMENAGLAVYTAITRSWQVAGRRFVVLCGIGNNGGDGLVAARKLRSEGARVVAVVLGDPERYTGAARLQLELYRAGGGELVAAPEIVEVEGILAAADLVVDGLLGTGLTRDVDGRYAEVIAAVNGCNRTVVAIDIPSGVDGDTGQVRGVAVRADLTVTFGLPKLGNMLHPGAALCGRLVVSHISFPPELWCAEETPVSIGLPSVLPPRSPDGYKGSFGDVLVVAGAAGYYGAPTFAAMSVLKAGAGYVRLAAPRSAVPGLATGAREAVFVPQPETAAGSLALSALDGLVELGSQVDFVVIGPGVSLDEETAELVRRLVSAVVTPILVDGDGLTAVAADLDVVRRRTAATVLTPHPGEMARLVGSDIAAVRTASVDTARGVARDLGAVTLLKGARTLIALPDGTVRINPSGCSALATAGSGDVLTGTIAALHGLGLPVDEAVVTGVFVHGLAGDIAAERHGEDGVTAGDVLAAMPAAVRRLREDRDALVADHYGILGTV